MEVSLGVAEKKSVEVLRTIADIIHITDFEDTEKIIERVRGWRPLDASPWRRWDFFIICLLSIGDCC